VKSWKCSISSRSVWIQYSVCSNCARNNFPRRNRRTSHFAAHGVEAPEKGPKHLIHHDPDRAERMILPHPRFGRQILNM
jgi:hypothetical protein